MLIVSPCNIEKTITAKSHASRNVHKAIPSDLAEMLLNKHLLTADRDGSRVRIPSEPGNTDKEASIGILSKPIGRCCLRRVEGINIIFVRRSPQIVIRVEHHGHEASQARRYHLAT